MLHMQISRWAHCQHRVAFFSISYITINMDLFNIFFRLPTVTSTRTIPSIPTMANSGSHGGTLPVPGDLDLSSVCDGNMLKFVSCHASALGVPADYIFFPLMSSLAGALRHTEIEIHEEWREKCAIWSTIVARRGSKRSATLNRFVGALDTLQSALQAANLETAVPENSSISKSVGLFRDELHLNCLIHEDLNHVFNVLSQGTDKTYSDRMKKHYDLSPTKDGKVSLNLTGFLVAHEACHFLQNNSADMTSRFLMAWPRDVLYLSKDYKVPIPANTPSLKEILEVLWMKHTEHVKYVFRPTCLNLFSYYADLYRERIADLGSDEARYCHLNKAPGQLARVACILSALRQALKYVVYREDVRASWNYEIGQEDLEAAKIIVDHAVRTKLFILSLGNMQKVDDAKRLEAEFLDRLISSQQRDPVLSTQAFASSSGSAGQGIGSFASTSGQGYYSSPKRARTASESSPQASPQPTMPIETKVQDPYYSSTVATPNLYNSAASVQPQTSPNVPPYTSSPSQAYPAINSTNALFRMPVPPSQLPPQQTTSPQMPLQPTTPVSEPGQAIPVHPSNTPTSPASGHSDGSGSGGGDQMAMHAISAASGTVLPIHVEPPTSASSNGMNSNARAFFNRSNGDHPLGFFEDDPEKFIEEHGTRIKKLLEFRMDYRISPSTCAQRHLIPPLSKREMLKYDTQTKYPVQIAKEFLVKVAELGFGSIETVIHPANRRRSSFFQKFPFEQLAQEARNVLSKIGVSEVDYMSAFLPNGGRDVVYGFHLGHPGSGSNMGANIPMTSPMAALAGVAQMALNAAHSQQESPGAGTGTTNGGSQTMLNPKSEPLEMGTHDSDESHEV